MKNWTKMRGFCRSKDFGAVSNTNRQTLPTNKYKFESTYIWSIMFSEDADAIQDGNPGEYVMSRKIDFTYPKSREDSIWIFGLYPLGYDRKAHGCTAFALETLDPPIKDFEYKITIMREGEEICEFTKNSASSAGWTSEDGRVKGVLLGTWRQVLETVKPRGCRYGDVIPFLVKCTIRTNFDNP